MICGILIVILLVLLRFRNQWLSRRIDRMFLKARRDIYVVSAVLEHREPDLQLWALVVIPASDQQCNTKRSRHDGFFTLSTLTES